MRKYSKYFLIIALLLSSLVIMGCNKKPSDGPTPGKTPSADEQFWDKDGNGIPDWQEEEVTIRFATWAYNDPEQVTIDTLMVEEFMKKYPNITVEMQIVGEDAVWDESMIALLETEDFPDVFLVRRMETFLAIGVLEDITDMYDHDPDTDKIFDSVRDLGVYKDKRYIIPTYFYPQFWIVNKDILQASNVQIPTYDWTWDQMEAIAQATTNTTNHTIGLFGTSQYIYEGPKAMETKKNPDNGWYAYGYNGEKFDFMSDSYLQSLNRMEKGISEGWLVNALDAETIFEYYGQQDIDPRYTGHVAIWREASWSVKAVLEDLPFEYDIYPGPNGIGMGNTDIAAVSALTKHREASYQLLKWMSYSEEGVLTRFRLFEEYSNELFISGNNYPYPIVDYGIDKTGSNKIWESIPYGKTAPGLVSPEFIEAIRNAATQANKEVIGWDAVDQVANEYWALILNGENTFASLREVIQQAADQAYKQAKEAIDEAISK